jgi:hypothetical protein
MMLTSKGGELTDTQYFKVEVKDPNVADTSRNSIVGSSSARPDEHQRPSSAVEFKKEQLNYSSRSVKRINTLPDDEMSVKSILRTKKVLKHADTENN